MRPGRGGPIDDRLSYIQLAASVIQKRKNNNLSRKTKWIHEGMNEAKNEEKDLH